MLRFLRKRPWLEKSLFVAITVFLLGAFVLPRVTRRVWNAPGLFLLAVASILAAMLGSFVDQVVAKKRQSGGQLARWLLTRGQWLGYLSIAIAVFLGAVYVLPDWMGVKWTPVSLFLLAVGSILLATLPAIGEQLALRIKKSRQQKP